LETIREAFTTEAWRHREDKIRKEKIMFREFHGSGVPSLFPALIQ
jgi:hypothetical protein